MKDNEKLERLLIIENDLLRKIVEIDDCKFTCYTFNYLNKLSSLKDKYIQKINFNRLSNMDKEFLKLLINENEELYKNL